MTTTLEGGEVSALRPGRSLPSGKSRYPLYRRLGGPQGRSGQVQKISPPPKFDPRTAQPVASHYTDWVTRPTYMSVIPWKDTGTHLLLGSKLYRTQAIPKVLRCELQVSCTHYIMLLTSAQFFVLLSHFGISFFPPFFSLLFFRIILQKFWHF